VTTWHSVNWAPSKHRWILSIGVDGRKQEKRTVPPSVAPGPRFRKAAEQWAQEQINPSPEAVAIAPINQPTLAELAPRVAKLWRGDERLKAKTKADRESFLRNHILPALGKYAIAELNIAVVSEWVRKMRKAGGERQSLINRLSTLATLLRHAHSNFGAPKNDVCNEQDVKDELPKAKKRSPVALHPDAISALLSAPDVDEWFQLAVGCAALAGVEAGVVFGLEVRDVLLEQGRPMAFRVRQAVALLGEQGYASIQGTKNEHRGTEEQPRVVPIHPTLAPKVAQWLADGRERWCCRVAKPKDLLIPSASGKAWRPKVAARLRKELSRLGIAVPSGLDFHALRGCFLTWLAAAGVPKDVRRRLAGHSGDVQAEHYESSEQLFEADREAVSRIKVEVQSGRKIREHNGSSQRVAGNNWLRCQGVGAVAGGAEERIECDHGVHRSASTCHRHAHGVELAAVPNAVREAMASAQQASETACFTAPPARIELATNGLGREYRCAAMSRYRIPEALKRAQIAPRAAVQHRTTVAVFDSAVPNAVQEARDGLRWMLLGFDSADAMLAGLEEAP
jgi:integrase